MKYKCKKVVAALLTAAMVLSLSPILAFAEGGECNHRHDVEICGFVEAVAEVGCDKECIDINDDGVIDHVADCAFTPAVAGVECSHQHDESCGGLQEEQPEQEETVLSEELLALQQRINDLPTGEEYRTMTADEQEAVYEEAAELSEEYIALTAEEQEQLDITIMAALFAVMNEGIETYEGPVTFRNSGYPYGKNMSSSGITLVIEVAGNPTSYQWQVADSENGTFSDIDGANGSTYTFTPANGKWYHCVVNGTASEAVMAVYPGQDGRTWTYPNASWYIGNGTMAYMSNGTMFDVTGLYTKNNTDYMLQTSYSKSWDMYSSTSAEPTAGTYSKANAASLEALRVSFDSENDYNIIFEADLSDGQEAFSFGCDTQLGDSNTSGSFSDDAALKATVDDSGVLQQVAMVGAATVAGAANNDPAFVIAPVTSASRFWIGRFSYRQVYAYNTSTMYGVKETKTIGGNSVATLLEGADSGMTMSWLNIPSGGSVKFRFSVGSVANTGAVSGKIDYEREILKGLDAGQTYTITVGESTYTITADANGEIPLSGTDKGGKSYDFAGETLRVARAGGNQVLAEIPVASRPAVPAPPSYLGETGGTPAGDANTEIVALTQTSATIRLKDGQQHAYSTDNGASWTTITGGNENYVISGLTEGATVSIRTRVPATDTTPASQWSESTEVTLKPTVAATATGWSGTYDGNNHPITVNVTSPAEGATVTYSNTVNGSYSAENPPCVSAGTYTVYYRVTAEGYYLTYGSATVNIERAAIDAQTSVQPADRTSATITLYEVAVPSHAIVEYACSTGNTAPATGWQTGTTFSGLEKNTTYYFFARYKEDDNHASSPVSTGTEIRTLNRFTVTFDAKGGTLNGAGNVQTDAGTKIAKPADTSRGGYRFRGWFKDEALTQAWDFENDTVTGDTTLYAGWKKKSSDSTPDGGSASTTPTKPETETKPDGTEITTETKADGTKIETVTKPDGTEITTETKADGTKTETETKPDGTKTETEIKPDGTKTTTVTDPDGGQKYTQEKNNGVTVEAEVTTDGKVTGSISVPSDAEGELNWIAIPAGDGNVVIRTLPDGTQEPVEFGVVIDGMAYVLARESADIQIETREGLFDDMTAHWAENASDFTGGREIFKGTDYRTFSPEKTLTRGMMVAVLYRMEQKPVAAPHTFIDVNEKLYYNPAIAWAAETGVAKGYDEVTFGAEDVITREQMAVMMFKYAKACDYDLSTGKEMIFADEASISSWAKEAMDWAVSTGILSGRTGGIADPQGATTRAEASAIMERFIRNVVGKQS